MFQSNDIIAITHNSNFNNLLACNVVIVLQSGLCESTSCAFEVSRLASRPEAMYKLAACSKSSNQTAVGIFFTKKILDVI